MKTLIPIAAVSFALILISCEEKTKTTVYEDGGQTTVKTIGLDEKKIDSTAAKVESAAKNVAEKTGEALEDAGKAIKKGAKSAEKDIKEATDGDGDPNR